jgi:DNA-binding MarR family transcriptional regulator
MEKHTMSKINQLNLRSVKPEERNILYVLRQTGAASADQLAVKLNRIGEDLTPQLDSLERRNLLKAKNLKCDGSKTRVYITNPRIRRSLSLLPAS